MGPIVLMLLVMVVGSSFASGQAPGASEHGANFDSVLVQLYGAASREWWALEAAASDSARAVYRPRTGGSDLVITSIDEPPWMYYCSDCIIYLNSDLLNSDLPVTDFEAVEIARKAGLEIGVKPWRISRHWYHGELQRFVWTVENTLGKSGSSEWGHVVVIDAANGAILERDVGWQEFKCFPIDSMRPRN